MPQRVGSSSAPLLQVPVEGADSEQQAVDVSPRAAGRRQRQPLAPLGHHVRGQAQIGLLRADLQDFPPERPTRVWAGAASCRSPDRAGSQRGSR
jgi:hypothetical protein